MKHTHIPVLKKDLDRFKTACEININTNFLYTSDSPREDTIICHIEFKMLLDIFYLGAKWERNA